MAQRLLQNGGCCDGVGCYRARRCRYATSCLLLSITLFFYAKLLVQGTFPVYFWSVYRRVGPFSPATSSPKSDSEARPEGLQGQVPNYTDPQAAENRLEPKSGSEKRLEPSSTGNDTQVHDHSSGNGFLGENFTSASDLQDHNDLPSLKKFTVFVGVFMMDFESGRRKLIRAANAMQSVSHGEFTVRFVIGNFQLPEWLYDENATHGDLIVLPCKENINSGKTYTYFATLPGLVTNPFDYVMKTDYDSYVRFENLGKHLETLPRKDLYYGFVIPCDGTSPTNYRTGAGYILSWDLVLWIGSSPIPRNHIEGIEDMLVGQWFEDGGVGRNQPIETGLFHEHPWDVGQCAMNLTSETILVHHLKTDDRWRDVLAFFNDTHS